MYYKPTIKNILLTLVAAISLPFVMSSCADNDEIEATPTIKEDEGGLLSISFSTGGDATTRTASDSRDNVASNSALNEDKITRLDLFVVGSDNNISIHKYLNVKTSIDATSGLVSYTDDNEAGATDQLNAPETGVTYKPTWTVPGLTYSSVTGKTVYLIANWTNCPDNISTLSGLTSALTSDNGGSKITPYSNQDGFFMDGKIEATTSNLTTTDEKNYTLNSITLKRAVAKIRLTVYLEEKEESDPKAERTLTDLTNTSKVTYKLMNYATEGTVVADNSDEKVRCEKDETSSNNGYVASTINLASMESALAGNSESMEKNIETITETTKISYEGKNYNISNYNAAVFYVYPNDWINPWYRNDDYTLTAQILTPTSLPIIEARRTYFMLTGIYYDNKTYDYTVPVNYQMPTDNDKKTIADYSDLYQLKRNHIYDVIAILDRQGGQNGLYLVYRENPWTQGSSYTLSDFMAELNFDDNSKVYTVKNDDINAIKVAYDETNKTSYSPKMTISVSGSKLTYLDGTTEKNFGDGIGDKPWIIHTDNPYFGFLVDGKTEIVDQISCEAKTTKATFQLVPKVALADNPSPLAKVYVTVVASGTSGEIYLSTPSDITVPMEGNKILFYQVATDDYNTSSNSDE